MSVDPQEFADFVYRPTPVVATAIHAGHRLPDYAREEMALSEEGRLREEDPYTDRLAAVCEARIVCHYSRFMVDVNRPREDAVYRTPDEAWGLDVWSDPGGPPEAVVRRSLRAYDRFYDRAEAFFRRIEEACGRFVVLDLHSYNHRRRGADAPPADPSGNPVVNLGTGSLDRERWGAVVDAFEATMSEARGGERLDVRENVRFRGGHFVDWIHETFPETGCGLAVEFKKTFMDEWTGVLDPERLSFLKAVLSRTAKAVGEAVRNEPVQKRSARAGADHRRPGQGGGRRGRLRRPHRRRPGVEGGDP